MLETNWLLPENAIAIVHTAKADKRPLLGFNAAFLGDGVTRPSLEDSWDYANKSYPSVPDAYEHAAQFIQERASKGLRFEIILGDGRLPIPKWVVALCAIPVSIAAMLFVIWLLRHHYLSINNDGSLSPRLSHRAEGRIILLGLIAPFLAVLFAIIAFFMRRNDEN
jgi:hypothetical protein